MTTRWPWRASAAFQGRSYWCVTRAPTACSQQAHRLAGDRHEALHAEHVVGVGDRGDTRRQGGGVGDLGQRHDEAVEIVVVVLFLGVVAGAAVLDVVLGADAEAEQRGGIDLAVGHGDDLDRPRQRARDAGDRPFDAGGVEQVALVQHHQVGAGELILEHFLDRIVVLERGVGGALAGQRLEVGGDATFRDRRAIDHRHHAIDGDAALDRGPVKGLHQRFRQRETGGLDHDVIDRRHAVENGVERRHELVRHRAAQAAIGELDDVLLRAGGVAAAFAESRRRCRRRRTR